MTHDVRAGFMMAASARVYASDAAARSYARHRSGHGFVVDTLRDLQLRAPAGPALEIGCGTGVYASALARQCGAMVCGIDPSDQMLAHTSARGGVHYLQGHATRLPIANAGVSLLFSINVIHHIRNPADYFDEAFRILKPGGMLCTATDTADIIARRRPLSHYWPSTVAAELARYHDVDTLQVHLTAAGFLEHGVSEGRAEFTITDAGAYRDKAFSCLHLIGEHAFAQGLAAMESDLRKAPLTGVSELAFLWARRP